MPVNVSINDDRWQFIAGDKYWVIGTLRFSGIYTTGGTPVIFVPPAGNPPTVIPGPGAGYRDPGPGTIKASRAPWFAIIPASPAGGNFVYQSPSSLTNPITDPPNTVGTTGRPNATTFVSQPSDINDGKLLVFSSGGIEIPNNTSMTGWSTAIGLFLFQGME
jgi:hypothetical protein